MKALVAEDDRILGFTVFGVDGGETMSAVSNRHDCGVALYRAPGCDFGASDAGRRPSGSVLVNPVSVAHDVKEKA